MIFLLTLISTIVSFVALLVALPECAEVYHRFMRGHLVECPERHQQSTVAVSPVIAASTSAIAGTLLVVRGCALWPEHKCCSRRCITQLQHQVL